MHIQLVTLRKALEMLVRIEGILEANGIACRESYGHLCQRDTRFHHDFVPAGKKLLLSWFLSGGSDDGEDENQETWPAEAGLSVSFDGFVEIYVIWDALGDRWRLEVMTGGEYPLSGRDDDVFKSTQPRAMAGLEFVRSIGVSEMVATITGERAIEVIGAIAAHARSKLD